MTPPSEHSSEAERALRVAAKRIARYAEALEQIRDQEWVENVLDPQWAARIAGEVLRSI